MKTVIAPHSVEETHLPSVEEGRPMNVPRTSMQERTTELADHLANPERVRLLAPLKRPNDPLFVGGGAHHDTLLATPSDSPLLHQRSALR